MSSDIQEKEKQALTPESGFNLVGIDPFSSAGNKLYLVEHFEKYQDALKAKQEKDNPDEYLILYPGAP
jgi:hypothetical protein